MKKLLTATVVALTFSTATLADSVSWDAVWGDSEGHTIHEMVFAYNSQSIITDIDMNDTLSAGDTIHSVGGFGSAGFDTTGFPLTGNGFDSINMNQVQGFVPNPFPVISGYGSDYVFTISFNDFIGTYNGSDFVYSDGTIEFGVFASAAGNGLSAGFNSLFDIDLSYGGPINSVGQQKQEFTGLVGNFANGAGDDFSINAGGNKTLAEWAALGDIRLTSHQTVNGGLPGATEQIKDVVFNNGVGLVAASHTGRLNFTVPEPTSIAILGLGLLGFAGARRRKS